MLEMSTKIQILRKSRNEGKSQRIDRAKERMTKKNRSFLTFSE